MSRNLLWGGVGEASETIVMYVEVGLSRVVEMVLWRGVGDLIQKNEEGMWWFKFVQKDI